MTRKRTSAILASFAVGLGSLGLVVAGAQSASAATCFVVGYKNWSQHFAATAAASGCSQVGVRHYFAVPGYPVMAWTTPYYGTSWAQTPSIPKMLASYHGGN